MTGTSSWCAWCWWCYLYCSENGCHQAFSLIKDAASVSDGFHYTGTHYIYFVTARVSVVLINLGKLKFIFFQMWKVWKKMHFSPWSWKVWVFINNNGQQIICRLENSGTFLEARQLLIKGNCQNI